MGKQFRKTIDAIIERWFWFLPAFIFLIIAVIAIWYFSYSRDAYYIFPAEGQSKYEILGQAGDYFGGILNPIFGFLTVIILLITLHKDDKAKKEDRENLKEANKHKKLEQITVAIKKSTESLMQEINNKKNCFIFDEAVPIPLTYHQFCFEIGNKNPKNKEAMIFGLEILSDCQESKTEIHMHDRFKDYAFPDTNLVTAFIYKLKVKHIVDLSFKKIDLENSGLLKRATFFELVDLSSTMRDYYLITNVEFEIIENKFKSLISGIDLNS